MDDWRESLPSTDQTMLYHYQNKQVLFVWREAPHPHYGQMRVVVEARRGERVLAASDPVPPDKRQDVIRGCTRQMLVRLGTYFREHPAE